MKFSNVAVGAVMVALASIGITSACGAIEVYSGGDPALRSSDGFILYVRGGRGGGGAMRHGGGHHGGARSAGGYHGGPRQAGGYHGGAQVNRGTNVNRNVNRNANVNRNVNRNTNVNRNVNRNVAVNRGVYHGGAYRGAWVGRPYRWAPGGAIAAGAAIGFLGYAAASTWAPAAPEPGLCWYYTDASQRNGFWDSCP